MSSSAVVSATAAQRSLLRSDDIVRTLSIALGRSITAPFMGPLFFDRPRDRARLDTMQTPTTTRS